MSKYDIFFELNESAIYKNIDDFFLDAENIIADLSLCKKGPVFSYNVMREKNKIREARKKVNSIPEFSPMAQRVLIAVNEIYKHTAKENNDNVAFSMEQLYHAMGYRGEPDSHAVENIENDVDLLLGTNINFRISDGYFEYGLNAHALEAFSIRTENRIFFCLYRQPILMEYIENPFEFWSRNFSTMQKGMENIC